jgi:hypothetical protein
MTAADLKCVALVLSTAWVWVDRAVRDGADLPDSLRESLYHARTAVDAAGAQLVAHLRRGDSTTEDDA